MSFRELFTTPASTTVHDLMHTDVVVEYGARHKQQQTAEERSRSSMALSRVVRWVQCCPARLRPAVREVGMLGALVTVVVRRRAGAGWWGKIRRLLLLTFRPTYVRQQLARRQGSCNQCGACCRLVVTCPFLHDNRCAIYGDCRPKVCLVFPIDARDLTEVADQCSYTFAARVPNTATLLS